MVYMIVINICNIRWHHIPSKFCWVSPMDCQQYNYLQSVEFHRYCKCINQEAPVAAIWGGMSNLDWLSSCSQCIEWCLGYMFPKSRQCHLSLCEAYEMASPKSFSKPIVWWELLTSLLKCFWTIDTHVALYMLCSVLKKNIYLLHIYAKLWCIAFSFLCWWSQQKFRSIFSRHQIS